MTFTDRPSYGIRWRNWYYIIHTYDNGEELYDLDGDPRLDVVGQHDDMATFFRAKFLDWLIVYDNLERKQYHINLNKLPEDVKHNLRSLGYIE